MRVITLRPGETPKYNEIPSYLDLLQALQHFCKGYIETVEIKDGILAIVNEEGRLLGMDIACVVPSIRQSLCGPVVFCRHDDCGQGLLCVNTVHICIMHKTLAL